MILDGQWRKATKSANSDSCVEMRKVDDVILDDKWRKATKSNNNGACAELRAADGGVEVRHSKNPDGPTLTFTANEWDAFLDGAKNGEFEIA